MSNKRNPRRKYGAAPAYLRWLRADQRDKASTYRTWQIAESNRRRAIESAPFNERNTARPVVAA